MTPFDPVSPSVHALVELFASSLAAVKFPDVDAAALAASLAEVRLASEIVAEAETALEAARKAREASVDELVSRAEKALAYAKVYAVGNDALSAELAAITLPRRSPVTDTTAPKKTRGRPRKIEATPLLDASDRAAE